MTEVPYPAYIIENSDEKFRDFLTKCILVQFKSEEAAQNHKWLNNSIIKQGK